MDKPDKKENGISLEVDARTMGETSREADNELAIYCRELAQASANAGKWVERNSDLVRNEKEGLLKELRRAGRLFRSCERAAERKMCAGVFGPSQAGKSYLISALARGSDNELLAIFANETKDFVREINPVGGKESTGLVTRFTMTPAPGLPEGYPVRVRLLSETDIVKILANAYYADCEHKAEPQSNIKATLDELRQRAGKPNGRIDLDALEDLREYLARDFGAKTRVRDLERHYWEEALNLGQHLDLEGRITLYSLIWDQVEEFTSLLRKLLRALDSLDYPDQMYCALDALIPRETSIIDVATLGGLDGEEDAGSLAVCTPAGRKASLPKAVVAALTAELTITMKEKPADYFDYTDLLDFPGYRSRYKLEDLRKELQKKGMLKELFLRGKVAYLFQRYCAERELNSMLLCIGPSNQEVQDLPGVIRDWVVNTHGETPEDRVGKKVSLFFILTKFDMEFEDKIGAKDVGNRWDTRLHASLLDFFGKQYDWPTQWTPQRGFDNIFMLRNPNFHFDAVLDYDGDVETGIRPKRVDFVNKLHAAFIGSQLVAAHFRDPERAWNEAMKLNDGGISYIRESLSPLCDPEIKRQQLLQNINTCRENLSRRLKSFYKSDDKEELRKQKLLLIRSLFNSLGALEKRQQRMGELLHNLTVNDNDIYELHPEAIRRLQELNEREIARTAQSHDEPDSKELDIDLDKVDLAEWNPFEDSGGEPETASADAPAQEEKTPERQDEASFFANCIESRWVEQLHKLADDPDMQKFYMLSSHDFTALASELATGVARLGLTEIMARDFRAAAAYANTRKESIIRKQAAIAAKIINSYIDWLGFNPMIQRDADRTVELPGGKEVVVFSPPPPPHAIPQIGETRKQYTTRWLSDWLNALANLIIENINFDGGQVINVAENLALGAILKKLDTAPQKQAA